MPNTRLSIDRQRSSTNTAKTLKSSKITFQDAWFVLRACAWSLSDKGYYVPCLECIKYGKWGKQYFSLEKRSEGVDGMCAYHLGSVKFPDRDPLRGREPNEVRVREFNPNDIEILELTNMILKEYLKV